MTKNRLVLLTLAGLFALILFLRLHTYSEPLERDLTTYAVIAHEMLGGKALYSELWDHKPPAIHVTYAAAELIAGYGPNSILLMNVIAALVTLIACYFAGSALTGKPFGGLIAAAIWSVVSGDLALEANQPNTEVFLNALLTTAFAIFACAGKHNLRKRSALLIGILFAVASLYKQVAIIEAALLCLTYLLCTIGDTHKKAFINVAIIAAVGATAWALVFGYFFLQGGYDAFVGATFTYNHFYAGNIWQNLGFVLAKPPVAAEGLLVTGSLATLALLGLGLGLFHGPRRPWILFLGFAAGTHLAVLLPGQLFAHYYQLWLPLLAIGSAWMIAMLQQSLPAGRTWLSYALASITLAGLTLLELPPYLAPAEVWSLRKYGPVFIESDRVAHNLSTLLQGDETFYEWGCESGLYFTSKHNPPSGVFFAYPLLAGPLEKELWQRVRADLERTKPDVIVLEKETVSLTPRAHPMLNWVKQNYRAISKGGSSRFLLLARIDSRLERKRAIDRANGTPLPAAF